VRRLLLASRFVLSAAGLVIIVDAAILAEGHGFPVFDRAALAVGGQNA